MMLSNSKANIKERFDLYGLDETKLGLIHEHHRYLQGLLPEVLETFYHHFSSFHDISKFFVPPYSIDHAKQLQIRHWGLMLEMSTDETYIEAARRIGHTHFRLGVPLRDYVAAHAHILSKLTAAISDTFSAYQPNAAAGLESRLIQALILLAAMDLEHAMSAFVEDGSSIYL